ncbi:metalloprotease [Coemansia sp. RSA 2424]|nr:metalloprotease [Coemansia sp. RSA 2424]
MDFCKNHLLPDWTSGFEQRKTSVLQLPYEEYTGPMEKSASDANSYKLVRLPNNLVVMCVQDTQIEMAAAALSVDVGSNMDPVELQGLAHFLEHMLFMGTEKYPDENDNPEHPFSKFMIGNIEALRQSAKDNGLNLHEELLKFHNKYYSSDIMKLVVYGNHSLDQLVEWAASKFSGIKSKGDNVQRVLDNPVSAENLGKAVYFETINDKHMINIAFPVPNTKAMYRHDPFKYIAHLIGHEDHDSILAHLKKQGWATGLGVWSTVSQNNGFSDFTISINATPEGQECYADILRAIFAYVQMLVTSGPQEWIQQEISSMKRIEFDNAAKVGALDWALNYLHLIHNEYVAPEHVLSKDGAYETFNYDDILHCLGSINPTNFRVFLGTAKHSSIDCSETEPYFGTKYHVDSIPSDLLLELASDAINVDGLCLPEKNLFIPNDFTIKNANMLGAEAVLRPTLLKLNDNFELWFKQDDQFNTPKGSGRDALVLQVEGESNPMYVTLHINKFIDDMQQRLIDMTDEQFNNRVQSLIKLYQERVKNIDIEAERYSRKMKSGTYGFALDDKMVALLQTVTKEKLLEFWNKYINPRTAPAYTRIDIQIWSAKIWKPTVSEVKTYSAKTLALYGCLKSEGSDGLDISKVDEFICKAIAARKEQVSDGDSADTLVEQLKRAGLSESGSTYTVGKSSEHAKHTMAALELAIKDHDTFGNYSEVSHTNFATIGMSKTPDGMWLMEDYRKFQATQQLHGLELPAEVLVPKYSS